MVAKKCSHFLKGINVYSQNDSSNTGIKPHLHTVQIQHKKGHNPKGQNGRH